ncbi:cell division protein FtsW [Candidatus Endobugula sertula]|uniref:Probable peptidoglycan glycosyltransferase FtsW n=1 Tax=Candidatus Endobugula sertula TaxID=62101 RepID=A0A1D2QTQ7_9GAMM|nr:cell division protein FtsW [Candidatus Endobugula sertula]
MIEPKFLLQQHTHVTLNSRLLLLVAILLSVGLVIVASASMDVAAVRYKDPWFFVKRHLVYIAIALFFSVIVLSIPTLFWRQYGWLLFFVACVLLLVVLIPGVGKRVNGSQRWLQLGSITVQISELVKFCGIIFFASYLSNSQYFLQTQWQELFKPLLMLVLLMWLLLLEPDFGGAVVLGVTVGSMLFLAGAKLWQCLLLLLSGIGIMGSLAVFTPYRMERLVSFLDPWEDPFDGGYQLTQSLIAFGRGEWFGLGMGNSIQKLRYLPEPHTDFIFAIFVEEYGFIGVLILLSLFVLLIVTIVSIAKKALLRNDVFSALAVFGVSTLITFQVIINIGVASGSFPTKGLTLPFISYGGSSLIITCLLVALVLRIEYDLDHAIIQRGGTS